MRSTPDWRLRQLRRINGLPRLRTGRGYGDDKPMTREHRKPREAREAWTTAFANPPPFPNPEPKEHLT